MMNTIYLNHHKSGFYSIILLSILILIIYSNTFNSAWHFDDYPAIVNNTNLHLEQIRIQSVLDTFVADPVSGNRFYRPVSCVTFAVNWYLGNDSVTGYHVVNIILHIVNALLLLVVIYALFDTPGLKGKYTQNEQQVIALLATGLWAVNPIHTQAVTYIVQRMVLLATMFYVSSLSFYLKARLENSRSKRYFFFSICFICFLLAFGSKENAVTLPFSLLLVELCFFRSEIPILTGKNSACVLAISFIIVIFTSILVLLVTGNLFFFLKGYDARSFTLTERLMTEARVVIFYLSQIFYPTPERLSFVHDVTISRSLIDPWTTSPSIICLCGLIFIGASQIKKRPILTFSILFFFLNHIVESSVVPLELIFEHRNYLPSLFLFVPVAVLLKRLTDRCKERNIYIYLVLTGAITVLISAVGTGAYIRNKAWSTETSLWFDAVRKAPKNARTNQNIAHYYRKNKEYNKAIVLYKYSLSLFAERPDQSKALAYNNMGNIYHEMHAYESAIINYEKALSVFPSNQRARLNMIQSYIEAGKWEEALMNVDLLLSKHLYIGQCLNLGGFTLLKMEKPGKAVSYLAGALELDPYNPETILNLGMAYNAIGDFGKALFFLRQVRSFQPDNPLVMLCLGEVNIRAGRHIIGHQYLSQFCEAISMENVVQFLKNKARRNDVVTLDYHYIIPGIIQIVDDKTSTFNHMKTALLMIKSNNYSGTNGE